MSNQPDISSEGNNQSPNFIIINCDDLGYGDLPAYGNTVLKTPHIDRLSQNGVRFTSFYACNSLCTPSRFGLLTGRYPDRVGLGWVLGAKRDGPRSTGSRSRWTDFWDQINWKIAQRLTKWGLMDYHQQPKVRGIPEREITLAKALKSAGYHTGMVGKWHLGEFTVDPQFNPLRHGFDFFYGVPHSNDMKDFALYRNEECLSPDFTEMEKLTGLYTQEAIGFIRSNKTEPFFLYFAHTYPHQPLHASKNFKGKSKGGRYGDTVEEIDWSLGELLHTLEEQHLLENTLVIFTSDNGPWYNGSPGSLRGRKGQSFEGGYRIPTIAHWPDKIPPASVCDSTAMNIDWFPTCLQLAGISIPEDRVIDGKDISNLILGKDTTSPHECLYFYHNEKLEAIRVGPWKYIPKVHTYTWPMPLDKFWGSAGSAQSPWLFNLETDPSESYNLKDDHPEVIERLQQMFTQWVEEMEANPEGRR
ncbi:MAG: sulfatase [Anaerolineaceae bacterium]|nr:sulfatase [Anaerolineaceae bacterium]